MDEQKIKRHKRTRNKRLTLWFTEEEYRQINERCKQTGVKSKTDFIMASFEKREIMVISGDVKGEITKILNELIRQGTNLNQIAKAINEGRVSRLKMFEVFETLAECEKSYKNISEVVTKLSIKNITGKR